MKTSLYFLLIAGVSHFAFAQVAETRTRDIPDTQLQFPNTNETTTPVDASSPATPAVARAMVGDFNGDGSPDYLLYNVRPPSRKNWPPRCHLVASGTPGRMQSAMIECAKFRSRSHDAVIQVYDAAGKMIETHEHKSEFKEC